MNYTDEQLEAINSDLRTTVVIAAPGSGKTRVLVGRIQRLISDGVKPDKIAAITFTNNAADEMAARLIPETIGYCGTIHGLMGKLINSKFAKVGYKKRPTIISEDRYMDVINDSIGRHFYAGSKTSVSDLALMLSVSETSDSSKKTSKLESTASWVASFIKVNNLITYDMMLVLGRKLVRDGELDGRFDHVLVDEFQDSTVLDAQIYSEIPCKTLFVVGDPNQSIYGFRGGSGEAITKIATPENRIDLSTSFRNCPEIADYANRSIKPFNKVGSVVKPFDQEVIGNVETYATTGPTVEEISFHTQKLIATGHRPSEIAVLCRTNRRRIEILGQFRKDEIPVANKECIVEPSEWAKCVAVIECINSPYEDSAAFYAAKLLLGREAADRLKRETNFDPLSNHVTGRVRKDPIAIVDRLEKLGICRACVGIMSVLISRYGVEDLAFTASKFGDDFENKSMSNGVFLGTVHAAKGKEWNAVVLDKIKIPPTDEAPEIARIKYVGITRAKTHLITFEEFEDMPN